MVNIKKIYGEKKQTSRDGKHTTSCANVMGSLIFIDDVTGRSSKMNSEVYRFIFPAHIQTKVLKLARLRFTVQMGNDPKHHEKAI